MDDHPFAAFAAEFPNDNSALHLGTIWMSETVCGPAEAHLPAGVLAHVTGAPHKAAPFRRELRGRGVAAFGLVEAA